VHIESQTVPTQYDNSPFDWTKYFMLKPS